jgi:hypothetical protein
MAAKRAASRNVEAPIPNMCTPAKDNEATSDVMMATISAAQNPPLMAFSAPLTLVTSSQYQELITGYLHSRRKSFSLKNTFRRHPMLIAYDL